MNKSEEAMYYTIGTASIPVPDKLTLNTLNFALGIRAKDINENFDLIKYWIEAERLRIGGWGIVEGFDLTKDLNSFTINVGPGIIINEHGQEIHVPETNPPILAGPPVYKSMVETHTTDEHGVLKLDFAIYSNTYKHTITYQPPVDMECDQNEFSFKLVETGQYLVLGRDIEQINENVVYLPDYPDQEVEVHYLYANDRIDGIFLKKDGSEYQYEMDVISTSPSQQTVQDYFDTGYYLIGFAYWHVGKEIDVEFFTGDRTLRKIFVDKNNVLYLNGKPYKEKTVIYFVEPKPPTENDFWYNLEDEILYIWRPGEDGEYAWFPVNDLSRSAISTHQFTIAENPDDLQTFKFDGYPFLYFTPGRHQLTVIVDQVVIMEDQYDELYYNKKEVDELIASNQAAAEDLYRNLSEVCCGYGFKLKYPLERPSLVEVRVTHNIRTSRAEEDVFAHESFFGKSGSTTITDASTTVINAACQYQCLNNQIEVYKNGIRLVEGIHFSGMLLDGTIADASHQYEECDRIKIFTPLEVGDIISYRVLRPVASYANLKSIIQGYEDIANQCLEATEEMGETIRTMSTNVGAIQNTLTTTLASQNQAITGLQNSKMDKTAVLDKTNIHSSIYSGVISGKIKKNAVTSGNPVFIDGVSTNDFIVISYALSDNNDPILLAEGRDYTLQDDSGGIDVTLGPKWLNYATAKLYVTGLKIGV